MNDDAIIQLARRGDADAQRQLVSLFSDDLRGYVDHRTGHRIRRHVSLSDICQDAFNRFFRALDQLPEGVSVGVLRATLFRNAEWVIRDRAEQAGKFLGESAVWSDPAVPPKGVDPAGEAEMSDQLELLDQLIGRLDDKYSSVIRMRLRGMKFREIADQLDEKESTVRERYRRAYHGLRRLLPATDERPS